MGFAARGRAWWGGALHRWCASLLVCLLALAGLALLLPVFNMASPVVQGGQLRGVVVVRVAAAPFLHNFNAALPTPYGFYLSNRWGDFLVHPDAAQTFGFDRGQRILIQESFPQVAALVDGRAEEAVLSQPGTDDEEARVFAFVRMPFGNADEGRFMVVGLSQPLAVVQGEVLDLGRSILKILLVLSVVGVALAAGVSRLVTQPLQAMVKAAQAFSRGESHGALPVHRGDEVGELARSFQDMEQQISRQLAELNLSRDAMAHLAHHDALTGRPTAACSSSAWARCWSCRVAAAAAAPYCLWTWTTSRPSTTRAGTPWATWCCRLWPAPSSALCGRWTPWPVWPETSSRCCAKTWIPKRPRCRS